MNLNIAPTLDDLRNLFAQAKDNEGHHILWVDKDGEVHLSILDGLSPACFEQQTPSMKMRYETLTTGYDNVGEKATLGAVVTRL